MPEYPPGENRRSARYAVLDGDELIVGKAYARLNGIIDRLIADPFDRTAYIAMAAYLEQDSLQAADAFDRLVQRGDTALERRSGEIEAALDSWGLT